jgi:hypothetical protein
MDFVLPVLLAVQSGVLVWTTKQATKERQRLVNAVLARTPGEFRMLEAQANKPKKMKKAEAEAMSIPPIGL